MIIYYQSKELDSSFRLLLVAILLSVIEGNDRSKDFVWFLHSFQYLSMTSFGIPFQIWRSTIRRMHPHLKVLSLFSYIDYGEPETKFSRIYFQ